MSEYSLLREFDGSDLIDSGEWSSRSEFDEPVTPVYLGINRLGMSASNLHHWAARMATDSLNSPSPMRCWFDRKIRKSVESSKFYAESPKTALALRKYICAQFRPTAAMALYQRYGASRIYDPCGGWGDRMLAAQAMGIDYHCRDVNPLVFSGYSSQSMMYESSAEITCELRGSEIDAPAKEYFDFVFTSPPYWKIEKYGGKDSSHLKYKTCESWTDGFLKPMVNNAIDSLVTGGVIAINISDCYANHTYNRLVQPTIDAIKERCNLLEIIGYRMPIRANNGKSGIFAEPIIVGQKR